MFGWFKKGQSGSATLPPGAERRQAIRHNCDLRVNDRLIVSIGTSSWPAVVADISTTGIGLVVGIRHDPGTTLPLDLYCTSNGLSLALRVRVVRTQRMPDGHWFCGCCFDEQIGNAELSALL
jgi:hypothetical protein